MDNEAFLVEIFGSDSDLGDHTAVIATAAADKCNQDRNSEGFDIDTVGHVQELGVSFEEATIASSKFISSYLKIVNSRRIATTPPATTAPAQQHDYIHIPQTLNIHFSYISLSLSLCTYHESLLRS